MRSKEKIDIKGTGEGGSKRIIDVTILRKGRILRKSDVKGAGVKGAGEGTVARSEIRLAANLGEAGASKHARDGDGVDAITSGSNHGSEAGGREERGGGSGGDGGRGGGGEGRGDPEG